MAANFQYTSCPYPIIDNPLLPPVPICGRLDEAASYPDMKRRPSFLQPELIESLDSHYNTIDELSGDKKQYLLKYNYILYLIQL